MAVIERRGLNTRKALSPASETPFYFLFPCPPVSVFGPSSCKIVK
jgi:hypothetical protein